jgi:hypothetical protein
VAEVESTNRVGVLGASSFVGKALLPLLTNNGYQPTAFSRQAINTDEVNINWLILPAANLAPAPAGAQEINSWICVAPVWVLTEYLPWLKSMGAQRIVALSSTSRFTKTGSSDISEQALARRLVGSFCGPR